MKVSIVICTYNGSAYLPEQLNSFVNQNVLPDSLIVCDDKSTDSTLSILQDFRDKAPFPVTIRQNHDRIGTRENFQQAISLAKGDLIFLADQDDIWKPQKIEEYLQFFSKDSDALLLFSNGDLINESGEKLGSTLWERWQFDAKMKEEWRNNRIAFNYLVKNNNKVTGATIAFRSVLKEVVLPFYLDTSLWHDAWLALIAAGKNGLRFIDKSLIWYRVHEAQQVGVGNGYLMDPFRTEKNVLTARQLRLAQLNFEHRLASILPFSDIFNDQQIADELSFLTKKENYSNFFVQRLAQIMHWKQISYYNKFSRHPIRTIIKDIINQ